MRDPWAPQPWRGGGSWILAAGPDSLLLPAPARRALTCWLESVILARSAASDSFIFGRRSSPMSTLAFLCRSASIRGVSAPRAARAVRGGRRLSPSAHLLNSPWRMLARMASYFFPQTSVVCVCATMR